MRILHTSDWHLGHRLHEQLQYDEQNLFLSWLIDFIRQQNIDILLVSGDVFDTGAPSSQSLSIYYNFLVNLKTTACKHVIITGGNHDAPGTLNAPKEILKALDINVVGKATEKVEEEVFEISIKDEKVVVAAVPYLRDQDIRKAVAGENFTEIGDRYKNALINHYHDVAQYCNTINTQHHPVIGMGHLFAIGGATTDSEQTIYVGNAGDIGADDFPSTFDYIALGHLHRHQRINEKVRYSGSPYILSFSEVGHPKNVICLEISDNKIAQITPYPIPEFRPVRRVKGSFNDCKVQLQQLEAEHHQLAPWVEVVLDDEGHSGLSFSNINDVTQGMDLKVLKVTFKNQVLDVNSFTGESDKDIKDYTPLEVFKLKCEEEGFDISANPEVEDAFHEVLQIAKEQ